VDINMPDVVTRLRLDTSGMDRSVARAAGIGSAVGSAIGNFAGGVALQAVGAVTTFVTGSVDQFANLEDTTAAASVVFGSSMDKIIAQSRGAAASLGMSQAQVIGAANTFGTYGKAAGLAGDDLAEFSTDMTSLAGDMASFKGTTPEEAIEAIGAALRGESEPIRKYGVLLDDATLRARAMKMGLIDSVKEGLTPQQKALAAQAEILSQTKDAQGDFARTADSTANTQKRLAAETANAQAALGEKLAPAFTAVRKVGIEAMTGLVDGIGKVGPVIDAAKGFIDNLFGGGGGIDTSGIMTSLDSVRTAVSTFFSSLGAGFDWGSLFGDLGDLGATITTTLQPVGEMIGSVFGAIAAQVGPTLATISSVITGTVMPAVQGFIGKLQSALTDAQPFISMVASIVGWLARMAAQIIGPVVRVAFQILGGGLSTLFGLLGTLIGWIGKVLGWVGRLPAMFASAGAGLSRFYNAVVSWGGRAIAWLQALPGRAIAAVASLVSRMAAKGTETMAALGRGISGAVGRVTGAIRSVITRAVSAVTGFTSSLYNAGARIIQGLIDGIRSRIEGAVSAVSGALSRVRNLLPFSPAKEGPFSGRGWSGYSGRSIMDDLAGGITASATSAVDAARRATGAISGALTPSGVLGAVAGSAGAAAARYDAATLSGMVRIDPRDLAVLADALGVTVLLDGDTIASRVSNRIGAETYALTRTG
jgi:phage-related protein